MNPTVFKRRTNAIKHIKMFNIFFHKKIVNQNNIEILPHSSQIGYHQENNKRMTIIKDVGA
jgi:hypothetical protein